MTKTVGHCDPAQPLSGHEVGSRAHLERGSWESFKKEVGRQKLLGWEGAADRSHSGANGLVSHQDPNIRGTGGSAEAHEVII